MNSKKSKFIFLIILFFIVITINLVSGSVWIPLSSWKVYFSDEISIYDAILQYRLNKAFVAVLVGSGLALSGLLMQSIFKNPIVGPYVLGLSSGAGLGVALLILGGSIFGFTFNYFSQVDIVVASAFGSALTMLLVILLYYKLKNPVSLLIAGLMIGIFAGSLVNILSYFTKSEALHRFVFWSMGNLGGQSSFFVLLLFYVVLVSTLFIFLYVKELNALLLGENYAIAMGVSVKRVHFILILLTGILTGTITAFVGPIAFIGLAVPHLSRLYFKTNLHQYLVPATILLGAIILLFCDTIAQMPGSTFVLPINSITALFGAPLVVYFIYKK